MQDPVRVEILDAEAHFNEEAPNLLLWQVSPHLFLEEDAQVPILTVLHDYIQLPVVLESINEFDDKLVTEFVHQLRFFQ